MILRRAPRSWRGFTLIEMLVTVAIVGVLASISLPLVQLNNQRMREQELRDALRQIRTALDAYKQAGDEGRIAKEANASGYPTDLNVLVDGVADVRKAQGGDKVYFLRRIPLDPMFPESSQADGAHWGLRSYASPATSPEPGADVYDVYSLSTGVGLNGVPYRDW